MSSLKICHKNYVFLVALLFGLLFVSAAIGQTASENSLELEWVIDGADSPSGNFRELCAVDVGAENSIYLVDRGRHRVLKYDVSGKFLGEVGGFGNKGEQFNDPMDVDAHSMLNIFVADYNNNRIVRFDGNLNFVNEFKPEYDGDNYFEMPLGVVLTDQFDIFILEDLDKRVIKLNRFNEFTAEFGNSGETLGQLLEPTHIAVNKNGRVYVADNGDNQVKCFDYFGSYLFSIEIPGIKNIGCLAAGGKNELLLGDDQTQSLYLMRDGKTFSFWTSLAGYDINIADVALLGKSIKSGQKLIIIDKTHCFCFSIKK